MRGPLWHEGPSRINQSRQLPGGSGGSSFNRRPQRYRVDDLCGRRPLFGLSNNWQLAFNTVTIIVTLLMAVAIRTAQNRD